MAGLIIIPELDDPGVISKHSEVRLRRQIEHQVKRGGLRRILQAKRARAYLRYARMAAGRGGMAAGARGIMSGSRAFANPVGLVVAFIAAVGIAATRIYTDKPFDTWGYEIEEFLLGDMPIDAQASLRAREKLHADPRAASAALSGDPLLKKRFSMLKGLEEAQLKGERKIRQEMGISGVLDKVVIEAVKAHAKSQWLTHGLAGKVHDLKNRLDEISIYAAPFKYR